MGINWNAVAKNASAAIRAAGSKMYIRYITDSVPDPITGTVTGAQPQKQEGYGVLDNMNASYINRVGADNVNTGDMLCYFEVTNPATVRIPQRKDKLVIGLESWQIMNVEQIAPAMMPVLFILQVRK